MKEGFYGLISTLDTARGKNLWLRDYIRIIIKTQQENRPKFGKTEYPRLWNKYKRCNICIMGIPRADEKERNRRNT